MKAMKQLAEAPRAGCQTPVQQQCSVGRGRDCMGLLCRAARVDTRIESVPIPWFRLIGNFVPNLERLYSRAHSGQTRRGGL